METTTNSLFKRLHVCLAIAITLLLSTKTVFAQHNHYDYGNIIEERIHSKFNVDSCVQSILDSIEYKSSEEESLKHYFEDKLYDLQNHIFRRLTSNSNSPFNEDTFFKNGINRLIKDYNKYGIDVTDDLKLAVKKGIIFKGPLNLPEPQTEDDLPPPGANEPCTNMNFETGDKTGWEGDTGKVSSAPAVPYTYQNIIPGLTNTSHTIVTAGNDPKLKTAILPMVNPDGGSYSIRLGDLKSGRGAARIRQTFQVAAANTNFSYSYAVVLQDPAGHTVNQKPYFSIRMLDQNGVEINCSPYNVIAGAGIPGFLEDTTTFGSVAHRYKPWSTVFIPLGGYVGQNVTIEFRVGDCSQGGHYGYAYVEASCELPNLLVKRDNNDCKSDKATLTAPAGGASYLWTPGGQNTQSIHVNASGKYAVEITSPAGPACKATLEYEFTKNPKPPVANFSSDVVCQEEATSFTDLSLSKVLGKGIAAWEWDFGDGNTAIQQNPKYIFKTGGKHNVKLVVFNTNGCADSITKEVYVTPRLYADLDIKYNCPDKATVTVNLSTNTGGAVVEYSSDNGATWQTNNVFSGLNDGNFTFKWKAPGFCDNDTTISLKNLRQPIATTVDPPLDYCKGDNVKLLNSDPSCKGIKWFVDNVSQVPLADNCEFNFKMGDKDTCFYFEPSTTEAKYTAGASSAGQNFFSMWSNFEVFSPIIFNGFKVNGGDVAPCIDYDLQLYIRDAMFQIVAGPINLKVNCDKNITTVISNLNIALAPGSYSMDIMGAGILFEANGPIRNIPNVINIWMNGPFYDWDIEGAEGCPVRDQVCVKSICSCPDTSLNFTTPICPKETFDFSTILTATTSPGSWKIITYPAGANPAVLNGTIFNANKDGDSGEYEIEFTVDGGPYPGCIIKNKRKIVIKPNEIAKINAAGPFCESEGIQQITLDPTSTPGGTWSSKTPGQIDAVTGNFDPSVAGIGKHWIYYNTPGVDCPAIDSIQIEVTGKLDVEILTQDTTVCEGSNAFSIRLDQNLNTNGVWSGTGVDANGNFDPAVSGIGDFKIKNTITANNAACNNADSVTISVKALEIAKINPSGPFCEFEGTQRITLDPISTPGGTWSSKTPGQIDPVTGNFDPSLAGIGKHWIYYNTPGADCPAIDSIQVEVTGKLDIEILTQDTTVCEGSNTFSIRLDQNLNTNGIWSGTGVDANGNFDPTVSGIGDFKIKNTITANNAACNDADSVTISVKALEIAKINAAGPFCEFEGIQQITLDPTSSPGGTWSSKTPGQIDAATGNFDPSLAGIGKHWIYYNTPGVDCPAIDSIQVEVTGKLDVEILTQDTTVCEGSNAFSIRLDQNLNTNGIWSGTGVDANGNFDPTVSGIGDFKIKNTITANNAACSDEDEITIKVVKNADASIIPLAENEVCENSATIQINTTELGGNWSSTPINFVSNTGSFDPTSNKAGKTKIYYSIGGLCPDKDSIEIIVLKYQDPTISKINPVCESSADITLNAITEGTWMINNAPSNNTFSPKTLGPGTYKIKNLIGGKCPSADSIEVEVKQIPVTKIESNLYEGCVNLDVVLSDKSDSTALNSTWVISRSGELITQSNSLMSLPHTFGQPGCYDITLKSDYKYGCSSSASLQKQICAFERPTADFITNETPLSTLDQTLILTNTSTNANTYAWELKGANPERSVEKDLTAKYNTSRTDTFPVELIASNQYCSDTIVKHIIIKDIWTLFVPSAFTPNGDGINDVFFPMGKNHIPDDYTFYIFNRWGELIFKSSTVGEGWNGTHMNTGKDAQIDVYVWKIEIRNSFNNEPVSQVGHISLLR